MLHILFVCTGNTCRSPLAEGLLRYYASIHQLDVEVRSAGIYAQDGAPYSIHSKDILNEIGFQDNGHSKRLQDTDILWADYILTMTTQHKQMIIQNYPEGLEYTFTLKEFVHHNDATSELIKKKDQLLAEIELKVALSESVEPEKYDYLQEIEKKLPSFEISDPFGGDAKVYQEIADELKQLIILLIYKLKQLK